MTDTKQQQDRIPLARGLTGRVLPLLISALIAGLCYAGACGQDRTEPAATSPLPTDTQTELNTPPAEASPAEVAEPVPTQPPEPYAFGTPLEESEGLDDSAAFANAVFLGDSRTEGLQLWGGIKAGRYYWARGMTVFRVNDPEYTFHVDGQDLTMLGALGRGQYDKVYIMIGVNELGWPADQYEQGLSKFLDQVIAAQPEAVVYLQTLPPLNDNLAKKNLAYYINNKNVDAFNDIIVRTAAEKQVVLLDVAAAFRNEEGQLNAQQTVDGCHFTKEGYAIWADYLRCHTMDPQRYFYNRGLAAEGEEVAP